MRNGFHPAINHHRGLEAHACGKNAEGNPNDDRRADFSGSAHVAWEAWLRKWCNLLISQYRRTAKRLLGTRGCQRTKYRSDGRTCNILSSLITSRSHRLYVSLGSNRKCPPGGRARAFVTFPRTHIAPNTGWASDTQSRVGVIPRCRACSESYKKFLRGANRRSSISHRKQDFGTRSFARHDHYIFLLCASPRTSTVV